MFLCRVVDCDWISEKPFLMKRMMEGFFFPWLHSSTFFALSIGNLSRFEKEKLRAVNKASGRLLKRGERGGWEDLARGWMRAAQGAL